MKEARRKTVKKCRNEKGKVLGRKPAWFPVMLTPQACVEEVPETHTHTYTHSAANQ